jgi:hypothetical protein
MARVSSGIEVPEEVVRAETAREVEREAVTSSEAKKRWEETAVKALRLVAQGGFPGYAKSQLKIFDKAGDVRPFELNAAQLYLEGLANEQLQNQGFVRLIVVKARQMGISTYIGGRGYYKTTRRSGQKAFILAHELTASGKLFETVKNFHMALDARYRPHTQRSNQKELIFDMLKGGYTVGTAKQGETGRSFTVQFFHGSEVAFWPSADQIALGLLQTIGTVPGTEIWMESTGNGMNGYFYSAALQARKNQGDFRLAFLPWFWDPLYSRGFLTDARQEDFMGRMTHDDQQYMKAHALTLEQMSGRTTDGLKRRCGNAKAFAGEENISSHNCFYVFFVLEIVRDFVCSQCTGARNIEISVVSLPASHVLLQSGRLLICYNGPIFAPDIYDISM